MPPVLIDKCDTCRGEGMVVTAERIDWQDRLIPSFDTCPDCGGTGTIEPQEEE